MRSLVVLGLTGWAMLGCSREEAAPPAPAEAPAAPAKSAELAAQARATAEAKTPSMSIEAYEALMLALGDCALKVNGIDRECPAWRAFDAAREARGVLLREKTDELAALGRKHLTHANPAVRLQAARLTGSLFGASKESRGAVVAAAKVEKDPNALRAMLRVVRSSIGRAPEVQALLLSAAEHEDEQIRMTVYGALTARWADGTEGTLERALKAVEADPSAKVRRYVCRQLGDRADERALPLLEKLTAEPGKDDQLYAACFRGLIGMWASPVPHAKPSQAAYELTLARLNAKPRTAQSPPWAALANLEWAAKPELAANAPWFDKGALIAALADLAADRAAWWLARTTSVRVLSKLGAEPAVFKKLQAAYAEGVEPAGPDQHVRDEIAAQLAGETKP